MKKAKALEVTPLTIASTRRTRSDLSNAVLTNTTSSNSNRTTQGNNLDLTNNKPNTKVVTTNKTQVTKVMASSNPSSSNTSPKATKPTGNNSNTTENPKNSYSTESPMNRKCLAVSVKSVSKRHL